MFMFSNIINLIYHKCVRDTWQDVNHHVIVVLHFHRFYPLVWGVNTSIALGDIPSKLFRGSGNPAAKRF